MVRPDQPQAPLQDMQPVGPNAVAWRRVRSGDMHTIRDAQTFLNSHGYRLATDGQWGPQTATALKAYFRNVPAGRINKVLSRFNSRPNAGGPLRTLKPVKSPARVGAPDIKPPKSPRVRGHGGRGRGHGGGGAVAGSPMPNVGGPYDPKKLAQSMVNAEYGPAINQLKNLLGDVSNQDQYNQGQIHGYYQQMKNLANKENDEQGASTAAAEQQIAGNLGNVAQLFGGDNAGAMKGAVSNAEGYLGAVGKSQQDYLSSLLPLLTAQAASGTAHEQDAARAQQNNYQDQLAAQQHAKGQAYVSAYQQAINDQATQEQNQLALAQAQQLMPYKVKAAKYGVQSAKYGVQNAKYGAQSAKVGAQYAGASAQADLAGKQAQIDHYRALTTSEMASAKAAVAKAKQAGGGDKGVLAPGSTTANRIQSALYRAMTNGRGKVVIPNPQLAQRALFQNAIQQGLIDRRGRPLVPGAIKLLNSTLLNMYNRDQAWQANYKWNGRTFVPKK